MTSQNETMEYNIFHNILQWLDFVQKKEEVYHILRNMMASKQPGSNRIDYVFRLMTTRKLFPDTKTIEEAKSDAKSVEFRKLGNKYFTSNLPKYVEALKEYNKSICFAISTENMCTALSNRSAVFFKMEMFSECIESINEVRKIGIPENLKEKLARRERYCLEVFLNSSGFGLGVNIEMPKNEKIPFIAKCLKLRENDTFGRHIITDKDIPAGTVIAKEKPFCKIITNSHKYLRCAACLAEKAHILIPCDFCTQTMFCSKECKEEAWMDFHEIECPISGSLMKFFDKRNLLAFRMVVRAFLSFPDTQTMYEAMKKMEKEKKTVYNFDWSKELSPEEKYTPIHTLCMNEDKKSDQVLLCQYVVASLMFNLLKESTPIFSQRYLTTKANEDILKNLLLRHLLICTNNKTPFVNLTLTDTVHVPEIYGSFIAPFSSLINHSCCSNTHDLSTGDSLRVVTVKNIKAGEQIFKNYGLYFMSDPKFTRQAELFRDYEFFCNCPACAQDYPMYNKLPVPRDIPPFEDNPYDDFTPFGNWFKFKKAVKYIQQHGHLFPTKHLVDAEYELRMCFKIMHEDLSLRFREKIPSLDKIYSKIHHQHYSDSP